MDHKRTDGFHYEATYELGEYYVELKDKDGKVLEGFSKPLNIEESNELIHLLSKTFSDGFTHGNNMELNSVLEYLQSYISKGEGIIRDGFELTTIDSVIDALKDIKQFIAFGDKR